MYSHDLIETARGLTALSPRRPNQANLRRVVSTAYYAVFHCLAGAAANLIIGRSAAPRDTGCTAPSNTEKRKVPAGTSK